VIKAAPQYNENLRREARHEVSGGGATGLEETTVWLAGSEGISIETEVVFLVIGAAPVIVSLDNRNGQEPAKMAWLCQEQT